VRPDHLFLGTQRDNALDMYAKGRWRCRSRVGAAHNQAKLRDEQVIAIRALMLTHTKPTREIAKDFGITPSYASSLARGVHRKEVPW
jgi:hypothetical protein